MIRHFCDLCNKDLQHSDTDRPSEIQWYELSKMGWNCYDGKYKEYSAEICNDCLKAIVDEAKGRHKI